ncbi:AMIN domain-containing protein [uncultured Pseudodesulfovibrio sp.]|uniref:AMIN domain-containing protein n=1 Tax=uncultured Pseudodesulfovibrio sp. TaxID=2035858 RepID=UPI0029C83F31|nr:AMIN domain-containing protein [uncultured Pseudodesulfovibrio sp.]
MPVPFRMNMSVVVMAVVVVMMSWTLHTGTAVSKDAPVNEVRMAVDPTVLPPVRPPMDDELISEPDASAPEAESETPDDDVVVVVEEEGAEGGKEVPVEQAEEKPAPKVEEEAAPKPVAKPEPAPVAKGGAGTVRNMSLDSTDTGFTLVLACDRPVGDTSYMNLTGPRRLVIDLREKWKPGKRNVLRAQSGMVKHVVIGEHPDRLRFVIHFRTPPKGMLTPQFSRSGNSLTVMVSQP